MSVTRARFGVATDEETGKANFYQHRSKCASNYSIIPNIYRLGSGFFHPQWKRQEFCLSSLYRSTQGARCRELRPLMLWSDLKLPIQAVNQAWDRARRRRTVDECHLRFWQIPRGGRGDSRDILPQLPDGQCDIAHARNGPLEGGKQAPSPFAASDCCTGFSRAVVLSKRALSRICGPGTETGHA